MLFAAPTAFRAIKRQDADAKLCKNYNLSGLEAMFLAGEQGYIAITTRIPF